jgi:hypothetical protein
VPRYFFHIEDHRRLPDGEGTELPDVKAAQDEAVRLAGALLHDDAELFWDAGDWRRVVTDDRQIVLFVLHFGATEPAAPITYDPHAAEAKNETPTRRPGGSGGSWH